MAAAKKTTAKSNGFESLAGVNTDAFKEGFEKINKSFEQIAELQKDSMDAVMTATNKMTGTFEKLSSDQAAFAQKSFDETVKATQSFAQCKSPQEVLDVNTEFFRSAFESNMAQFNKMTEMLMTSGKEAVEPLTDNYNNFVEAVQSYRP